MTEAVTRGVPGLKVNDKREPRLRRIFVDRIAVVTHAEHQGAPSAARCAPAGRLSFHPHRAQAAKHWADGCSHLCGDSRDHGLRVLSGEHVVQRFAMTFMTLTSLAHTAQPTEGGHEVSSRWQHGHTSLGCADASMRMAPCSQVHGR